jgi:hypothetical protein
MSQITPAPVTLRDLVTNPPGKGTRNVGARYMLRDALDRKYRESIADAAVRPRYKLSVSEAGDGAYTVWVKVPSEKYDIEYDVVLVLSFGDGVRSVMSAAVRLYCNSPSWVFTLGYVATKTDLLARGWKGALGRAAVEPPSSVNKDLQYGFDKVTHKAIMYLNGPGGLVTLADLEAVRKSQPPDPRDSSLSAEAKMFEYEREREKAVAAARSAKAAAVRKAAADRALESAVKQGTAKTGKAAKVGRQALAAKRVRSVGSGRPRKKI